MDSTVVTATAAALGSLVGALVSVVTTWITQRKQAILASTEWKLRERESLYGQFLAEASRLAVDALSHSLERPDQLAGLYGLLSRIRLLSSDEVLGKAEDCCRRIVERYRRPNMTSDQLHAAFEANELDPLKEFSAACRVELLAMSSTV
jgi:hypothetical protein